MVLAEIAKETINNRGRETIKLERIELKLIVKQNPFIYSTFIISKHIKTFFIEAEWNYFNIKKKIFR